MVTTRSAGASEPLEMLQTPPKKQRKTRAPEKPKSSVCALKEASTILQELTPPPEPEPKPELRVTASPTRRSPCFLGLAQVSPTLSTPKVVHSPRVPISPQDDTPCPIVEEEVFYLAPEHAEEIQDTPMMEADQFETIETSPPSASTSKRRRSDDDPQNDNVQPKRARTDTPSHLQSKQPDQKIDMLFMFPKKDLSDDEEDLSRSAPPKSYADMIRRDRRLRSLRKKNNPFGIAPRRPLAKVNGQNPFGIDTFTAQELDDSRSANTDTTPPSERLERDERSAAPEPETPRSKGLFGSLRNLGSATIGRAQSLFGTFTPRSGSDTPEPAPGPTPQVRTEPRGTRKQKPVWEIEYPQLPPETPAAIEEEETESEKKRKAFEAIWGETNRDYDHLHTESIDGGSENLPYPIKKKPPPAPPVNEDDLDPATRAFRQERKRKNLERYGQPRPKVLPAAAPLFGPDSHYARRTVDPRTKRLEQSGPLRPEPNHSILRKRKAIEVTTDAENQTPSSEQTNPRTFQPYMEDEADNFNISEDAPSTPATKRQKTASQVPQTPRSALKAPGSVGRAGRNVMFNANPVASVKRMTPPTISPAPAGTYNPNGLFKTFEDDARDRREGLVEDSPSSVGSLDPSPNTRANTMFNSQTHPGDALTLAINDANPRKIDYVWHDPMNPEWRPSLANPQPGTFRFVPEDEEEYEEDMLAELQREETDREATRASATPEAEAPQPPSTPRMSHAELPKPPGSAPSTPSQAAAAAASSAGALEAANLERRRAEAAKTRPKTSSRLAEVTSARSRSPSPPGLDTDITDADSSSPTDSAAKTPSPQLEQGSWTWTDETNEYVSSHSSLPDFAYNAQDELIPSFALRSSTGTYDNKIKGPDDMTESERQAHYAQKYNDNWAKNQFQFDAPMTYEESGCGSKYIHDLIRTNDARHPEVVQRCDGRFAEEWDAHAQAIEDAQKQGKKLVATFPDRDGVDMLDADEE